MYFYQVCLAALSSIDPSSRLLCFICTYVCVCVCLKGKFAAVAGTLGLVYCRQALYHRAAPSMPKGRGWDRNRWSYIIFR